MEEITSVPGKWGNLETEFELSLKYWVVFQQVWLHIISVFFSPLQALGMKYRILRDSGKSKALESHAKRFDLYVVDVGEPFKVFD